VLLGEPMRLVAAEAGYSESAAYRHMRNHVRPELSAALAERGLGATASDFGARYRDLLDSTAAVRSYAQQTGDPRLALQAIQAEAALLLALMNRLGIDSDEALTDIQDGRALARAATRVLVDHPEAIKAMADDVHAAGRFELAEAMTTSLVPSSHLSAVPSIRQTEEP
jgi:AcrR family transcriptional regulator